MSKSASILFDDMFNVINVDGNKFERVSRLEAKSTTHQMELTLDFNHEIYPIRVNDTLTLVLASSLEMSTDATIGATSSTGATAGGGGDDTADAGSWRPGRNKGLDADYDYVMYGKIYKIDEGKGDGNVAYISYGGLLMALAGHYRHMSNIILGENVYLLLRKR
ncbi:DNA-directed RNA polymerases I, II, and III subunit RPABC3 [Serendipita sp. 401]|nr:DNA-directed RNA polymerases I, II, and III subunit RPABC3 [Serendipita sp. 401]KAG9054077.1 DNA-directed RNA polymerases I, II, and III subunit RPABC3 [Serendipita sp. 407]